MAKLNKNEVLKMRIKRIEKEIRDTPYHKGTEHHIGRLRAKLSKLNDEINEVSPRKKGGGGGGYAVKKQGDATIVLVGPPSAGKSTLLNKLTNAKSKIAPYEFTTVSVIPGMMEYKDARIQILDVPGLIKGAEEGKGRGREVLSVTRGADLVIILCDIEREKQFDSISQALEGSGIRLNKQPPNVAVEKKVRGGILIHSNFKQNLDKETIIGVANELGIKNAEINIKDKLTIEKLIDSFSKSRIYVQSINIINKIDLKKSQKIGNIGKIDLMISAENDINLNKLRKLIWKKLRFVRVYLVRPSEQPNQDHPVILKAGQSLKDVMGKLGTEFSEDKEKAKIWGKGSKFPGQEVSLSTKVIEGMQIRFI